MNRVALLLTILLCPELLPAGALAEPKVEHDAVDACLLRADIFARDIRDPRNVLYQKLPLALDCEGRTLDAFSEARLSNAIGQYLGTSQNAKLVHSALSEFLAAYQGDGSSTPLQRLVLQHDLWTLYEMTLQLSGVEIAAIRDLLAQAILRLALSESELRAFAGNYGRKTVYADEYDVLKPDRPFLPNDLLDDQSSWTNLNYSRRSNAAAPVHEKLVNGRSTFAILLQLPGARPATASYLQKLSAFRMPWILDTSPVPEDGSRNHPLRWNPETPQFPDGTKVALVRRMVAISTAGDLWATNLVESIQIRVFEKVRPKADVPIEYQHSRQHFFEFRLSRPELLGGNSGLSFIEREVGVPKNYSGVTERPLSPREARQPLAQKEAAFLQRCAGCHGSVGILSFNSYRKSFQSYDTNIYGGSEIEWPVDLYAGSLPQVDHWALERKRTTFAYGFFRGWLAGRGREKSPNFAEISKITEGVLLSGNNKKFAEQGK